MNYPVSVADVAAGAAVGGPAAAAAARVLPGAHGPRAVAALAQVPAHLLRPEGREENPARADRPPAQEARVLAISPARAAASGGPTAGSPAKGKARLNCRPAQGGDPSSVVDPEVPAASVVLGELESLAALAAPVALVVLAVQAARAGLAGLAAPEQDRAGQAGPVVLVVLVALVARVGPAASAVLVALVVLVVLAARVGPAASAVLVVLAARVGPGALAASAVLVPLAALLPGPAWVLSPGPNCRCDHRPSLLTGTL